jgi:16S rRNA (guanine966-N2)-methyltransferase
MRIIAGRYKGREILSPVGRETTRPITGLVRKSLFGMLGEDLTGQTVLDLYCGTGTLGLEALSRGAEHCWFADRDRSALHLLRRNLELLGAGDRGTIWPGDVVSRLAGWVGGLAGPVDVAFVDPPYADARRWDWALVGRAILAPLAGRLAEDGVAVLRLPGDVEVPGELSGLTAGRLRRYGDMLLVLLIRQKKDHGTIEVPVL